MGEEHRRIHVITGASSGIGRAVAMALAQRGELVAAVARSGDALTELADAHHPHVVPVAADVTTELGRRTIADAAGAAPVVGSLVHGAGSLVHPSALTEVDADELTEHFRVHVAAPLALHHALRLRGRIERIVHIDSYSASTPRNGWAAYSIVKAAAQMLARCADEELDGTIVLRVYPGAVRTPLVDEILASPSPAGDAFRQLDADGLISDPTVIGERIAEVLLDVDDATLRREPVRELNRPF